MHKKQFQKNKSQKKHTPKKQKKAQSCTKNVFVTSVTAQQHAPIKYGKKTTKNQNYNPQAEKYLRVTFPTASITAASTSSTGSLTSHTNPAKPSTAHATPTHH